MTLRPSKYSKALHNKQPQAAEIVYKAAEAIAKNDLLYVTGAANTGFLILGKADKDTAAKARTSLFFALHAVPAGEFGRASSFGVLSLQNTVGSVTGNPVFLSTAGAWTLTKPTSGEVRQVGTVGVVSATTGEVCFDDSIVPSRPHAGPIVGVVKATAGAAASLVFTLANLGGNYDGKPVVATLNTVDATATGIASAKWDGAGELTVTFDAASTGIVRVSVLVAAFGD